MDCDPELYKKEYDFFKNINQYIEYDELAENNGTSDISDFDYRFINSFDADKFSDLQKVCNKFIYLVDALYKRNGGNTFNADYDFDYLNYWLNARIHEIDPETICTKFFFQNLRSKYSGIHISSELRSEIYDIQAEDLDNLNTLYNLYKSFKELNKSINLNNPQENTYMEYAKNCINGYQELKKKCTRNEAKFCNILTNFKNKYEAIDLCKYTFKGKTVKKLPSLENDPNIPADGCEVSIINTDGPSSKDSRVYAERDEDSFDSDTQSITIGSVATIGMSFIFFIFYRFTSFGQLLRSRFNKNERIFKNINEEMNHFSHTSEYEHFNSERKIYGVAYNS
ncbi:PIR protein [Plasmodium ovale]|uniref:PIR Superfamily Protein n=2 Tax=Plasmodium ovale TaxID=36330 RepID=A0A1A8WGH0_PLAOA|nr:PIR Superfamily Protein [Plasmodium ovale curtisi]SBT83297.1 PIR protein [Plasmodium ovale]